MSEWISIFAILQFIFPALLGPSLTLSETYSRPSAGALSRSFCHDLHFRCCSRSDFVAESHVD